jgi:hypothetical protein
MANVLFSTLVVQIIATLKNYPLVDFSINVDGSYCLLVKYEKNRYYERCLSRQEIRGKSAEEVANWIVAMVESYFNGWAVRTGLVVR